MTTPILVRADGLKTYWLGVPGALQQLRTPADAVTVPVQRGETAHDLISGGTAVTHRRDGRRSWSLSFPGCTPDTADTLMGFYLGVFTDGPFCFIDPAWRNALHTHASTFGAVTRTITAWSASVSSQPLSFDTTIAAPVATSGVARWGPASNGGQLGLGSWNGTRFVPDSAKAPPYFAAGVTSIQVQARALTGTPSLSLRGQAVAADGTVVNTQTATATLSTSAWTTLTVTVPAGLAATYVLPNLLCNTANAVIQLACASVQYGKAPPDGWVIGLGIPRVVISAPLGGSYVVLYGRDHTLTLAES